MGFDDRCMPGIPAKMLCQKIDAALRCNRTFLSHEIIVYVVTRPNTNQKEFPGRHIFCDARSAKDAWLTALAKVEDEMWGKKEVKFNPNTGEWSWIKWRKNVKRRKRR